MAKKRGNVPTQSWSGKSAVFLMESAQTAEESQIKAKKKNMCVSDRPTNPNIFYAKKKIDRQNPEIRLRFVFVSDFNTRRLTVAILTLSDKRLIEADLLKTGFLFEFSSFPCTFDRCLEPVLMIQQSYNGRDVNSPFHMEREVQPLKHCTACQIINKL